MAIKQTKKNIFIDYIRLELNDRDGCVFPDDELEGIIERFTDQQPITCTASCYSLKYKVETCCPQPVRDLEITSGTDGAAYLIDEWSGTIYFDSDDPDNTAEDPADASTITVKYWCVDFSELMRELCIIISMNTTKLATIQTIAGLRIDTSQLSRMYAEQASRWASRS